MKVHGLISAEVTAASAQAGVLSHCQYLHRALRDGHHVPATISLHPCSLQGESFLPAGGKLPSEYIVCFASSCMQFGI